jgi:hypothetical protein
MRDFGFVPGTDFKLLNNCSKMILFVSFNMNTNVKLVIPNIAVTYMIL